MGWGILMTGLTLFGMLGLVLAGITMDETTSSVSDTTVSPQRDENRIKRAA